MKQNAGVIAVLVVVLTLFGITSLPKSPSAGNSAVGPKTKAKTTTKPVVQTPRTACEEIRTRLQPFVADGALGDEHLPGSCYERSKTLDQQKDQPKPEVASFGGNFVIATVPDPISTHLPLLFDRTIEVIQQAAQDDGYSYDSSWFPWSDSSQENLSVADQQAVEESQEEQKKQPGVVAFRRSLTSEHDASPYQQGLIVFVVAEQPTGGINATEFSNAVLWMERLGGLKSETFRGILGPTFSGSIPSLARAISPHLNAFNSQAPLLVASGSVSSETSYKWFQNYLSGHGSFRTATEGDALMVNRFCDYIQDQGYDRSRIALVSEDETAFGAIAEPKEKDNVAATTKSAQPDDPLCYHAQPKTDPLPKRESPLSDEGANQQRQGPVYLYYPRDIATLRSAYEQQSIFTSKSQTSSDNTPSTTLRGDLSEPASGEHDTVRTYGGQLTPLAQESVLQSIVDILRENHIEFIVLRSTNSLDQVFLSQFFRRAYPEARVVIDGADLLFRRGAEGSSLRGVIMLSTYPLITSQQDWTPLLLALNRPTSGESFRIFEEDVGEGLYIAARERFRNRLVPDVPISNYAPPAWALGAKDDQDNQRPATWISVIGQHQFWPVAVLNSHTLGQRQPTEPTILPTFFEPSDKPGPAGGERQPMRLPAEFMVLLIACMVWSCLHLLWCSRGSISPVTSSFRLAYFAPLFRPEHSSLIAFSSLMPALAATAAASTSGLLTWSLGCWRGALLAIWTLSVLGFSYFACRNNYELPPLAAIRTGECPYPEKWQHRAATVAGLLLLTFLLLNLALVYSLKVSDLVLFPGLSLANRLPTYWRSVHLLSGVSGLLPQLLLIAGLYAWCWCSLRGLALFGKDRPLLPKEVDLPILPDLQVAGGKDCPSLPEPAQTAVPQEFNRKRIMPMFSREIAGDPVEAFALPLGKCYWRMLLPAVFCTALIFGLMLQGVALRTLGEKQFGLIMFVWLSFCMAIILADTAQLWLTWQGLRPLLMYLDRLPLRRTLSALKGLCWGTIWALTSNSLEERYRIVSRQFESLRHLENCLKKPLSQLPSREKIAVLIKISDCNRQGRKLAQWYASFYPRRRHASIETVEPLRKFQEELAATAGLVMTKLLMPAWQLETESLILDRTKPGKEEAADTPHKYVIPVSSDVAAYVLAAEEFFLLPYLGFIQNILGRIRTIVLGSLFLFIASTFAVSSYPFDPLPILGGMFLLVFSLTGGTVIWVYAQMHRDATLSYITNTRPGELGGKFWIQLVTFGAGPLLGLLTTLFPSITDFLSSWILPSAQALK